MKVKISILCMLYFTLSTITYGTVIDSSELLFDDSKIHTFKVSFYIKDWQDSLKINFEEKDEKYIPAKITCGDIKLDSVGVRYKGNSSYKGSPFPKKPFKFKFDKYNDDCTFYDLKKLNFSNFYKDPSCMREKISYDVLSKLVFSSRTAYAEIYIEGDFIGLYLMVEQVNKDFLKRHYKENSGNLYKAIMTNLKYWGDNKDDYKPKFELKTNEEQDNWTKLINMTEKLNNTPDKDFKEVVSKYLNLDGCIKNLAFNMTFSNFDSYACTGRNLYLYEDSTNDIIYMIPWDVNMSFGTYSKIWKDPIAQDIYKQPNLSIKPLCKRLFSNPSLSKSYLYEIDTILIKYLNITYIKKKTELYKKLIDKSVKKEKYSLYSYDDFNKNIDADVQDNQDNLPGITSFTKARGEVLRKQVDDYIKNPIGIKNVSTHGSNSITLKYTSATKTISFTVLQNLESKNVSLELFSLNGKLIKRSLYRCKNNTSVNFNISDLINGFYLVRLSSLNLNQINKIIIINNKR